MRTASLMDINDTGLPASSRIQSPQRVSPRLPPELCDMIIDNLCGDKHSLSACTLVSHSWKRSARHHLFESVLVARQDDRNAYKHFLDFLSSAPDIGPTIRVICVDGYNQDNLVHGDIDANFMSDILDQIPKLKALLLLNCGWTRTKANNMHLYTRPQRSIGDLYINSFRAAKGPPHSKLEILRHFSHIDNLYLTRVWLGHFDVDDATGDISSDEAAHNHCPCEPPNVLVNTLTLSLADVCLNFLEYLRRQPFLSTLDSLTLRELWAASYLENHEDIHLVGDIIRDKMSSSLRTFEIDLPRHGPLDGPEVFTALRLDSCRSLSSISINLLLDGPEKAQEEMEEMANAHTHTQADDDEDDGIIVIDTTQPNDEDENSGAIQYATVPLFPHANPSPPLYSPAEWSVPSLLLSHLPPDSAVTSITLSIELTGPAHIVSEHLKNVPDWEGFENECLRFDGLKRVCVRRLEKLTGAEGDFGAEGEGIPVVRRWGAMDRLEICNRLSRLFAKKLLVFDM